MSVEDLLASDEVGGPVGELARQARAQVGVLRGLSTEMGKFGGDPGRATQEQKDAATKEARDLAGKYGDPRKMLRGRIEAAFKATGVRADDKELDALAERAAKAGDVDRLAAILGRSTEGYDELAALPAGRGDDSTRRKAGALLGAFDASTMVREDGKWSRVSEAGSVRRAIGEIIEGEETRHSKEHPARDQQLRITFDNTALKIDMSSGTGVMSGTATASKPGSTAPIS
jgi:hypothetical protein